MSMVKSRALRSPYSWSEGIILRGVVLTAGLLTVMPMVRVELTAVPSGAWHRWGVGVGHTGATTAHGVLQPFAQLW